MRLRRKEDKVTIKHGEWASKESRRGKRIKEGKYYEGKRERDSRRASMEVVKNSTRGWQSETEVEEELNREKRKKRMKKGTKAEEKKEIEKE